MDPHDRLDEFDPPANNITLSFSSEQDRPEGIEDEKERATVPLKLNKLTTFIGVPQLAPVAQFTMTRLEGEMEKYPTFTDVTTLCEGEPDEDVEVMGEL